MSKDPEALTRGAVDMHCHFGPDAHLERSVDCIEVAEQARDAGMAALVMKSHDYPTSALAYAVSRAVPGIELIGGIALDPPVGGLNPSAVEVSCRTGGKVVWMPTTSSENDQRKFNLVAPGLSILEPDGYGMFVRKMRLKREVLEIMALLREYDGVLETGHVSMEEISALLEAARDMNYHRVVVTHAMETAVGASLNVPQMREVAEQGGFLEHCAATCCGFVVRESPAVIADAIRQVGARHCVISTDYGQKRNIAPAPGYRNFIAVLLEQGIEDRDIEIMAKENPKMLLGLNS